MITVQLKGGIGNQLYQIAAIYSHAKEHNLKFVLNYELEFGAMQGLHPKTYKNTFYKNLESIEKDFNIACREPSFKHSTIPFLGIEHDVVYDGYYQSWKYFQSLSRDDLNSIFDFGELIDKVDNTINNLKTKNNVSNVVGVHIRRGDYFRNPQIFNIIKSDYYDKAKGHFDKDDTLFLYCTDDKVTVNKEFSFDERNILSNASTELLDLCLLSRCDSLIMANSSFSAWGGYLGKEKQKIFYPQNWFAKEGPSTSDLIDPNWIGL
tara:strand:+ start:157 stop:948 length:792 start_codon:yes stop_codon:yes gene_type:complete